MKKSFFLAAFAAALALVGCQKQSELDFDDIKTKATVQGYVYIDLGYIQEDTGSAKLNKPAEGVAVAVKVDYQKYDKDAAGGQKFFEAVCDANGFYKVEINTTSFIQFLTKRSLMMRIIIWYKNYFHH